MNAPTHYPHFFERLTLLPIFISLSISAHGENLAGQKVRSVGGVSSSLDDDGDETPDV